jgi:unsaturated rhamnogalacturonyl hydrolase
MGETVLNLYPDLWSIEERNKPKWTYTYGLVTLAMMELWEETGNQRYFDYARAYIDDLVNEDGSIKTYKKSDYNIDHINSGKVLLRLYEETGKENYRSALDTLRQQLREHPRTKAGGFWHKKRYPWQMWLDGLYMGAPFYVCYGLKFDEPENINDAIDWLVLMEAKARDPQTGLLYHAWDESKQQRWADSETGLASQFWGRAMGWYLMALVDVLDCVPYDHPKRNEVIAIIQRAAEAVVKVQDPETGTWYQVLDQGNREGNYLEGSATSMLSYFLLKAVKQGYIAKSDYAAAAIRGFDGLTKHLMKEDENGNIIITPVCAVAGLGGDPHRDGTYEYYVNEQKRDNDPKAVGPFIMAALLYDDLREQSLQ